MKETDMPDARAIADLPRVPGFPDYCYSSDWRIFRVTPKRGTRPGKEVKGGYNHERRWVWILRRPDGSAGHLHRAWLVCEHYHGPRPAGLLALHRNGQPWDDRKGNLRWGTAGENMADMVTHGRAGRARGLRSGAYTKPECVLRGARHPRAVLSESDVHEIRSAEGRHIDIAKRFGVSRSLIGQIKRGECWVSLEEGK